MTKFDNRLRADNNRKKWLKLGLVGAALLLIPRRSSRQQSAPISTDTAHSNKVMAQTNSEIDSNNKDK